MTPAQIESLFYAILEEKAIYNELTGISEDKIYNWRKGRGAKPTIGDMLNVLYQLKKVVIKKAAPGEVDYENNLEVISQEAWKSWDRKETKVPKEVFVESLTYGIDKETGTFTHTLEIDLNKIE